MPPATLVTGSHLARLARRRIRAAAAAAERCELCAAPLADRHRHLVDPDSGEVGCVCRPCALLFDRRQAAGGRRLLVPERARRVADFSLDDGLWDDLAIPVGLAYFYACSRAGRVRAFYPGPMGATESLLGLEAWEELERENPVLAALEPDVEALLVRRTGKEPVDPEYWIVPIDACYRLVALMRTRWRGLGGGREVWQAIGDFFTELGGGAARVDRQGGRIP